MTDDLQEYEDIFMQTLKKRKSYLGRIPSQDFFDEAYDLFLSIATPEELEEDIITRDTLRKMTTHFGWD
jgi:ssDNA-specific exonuclease RecJ